MDNFYTTSDNNGQTKENIAILVLDTKTLNKLIYCKLLTKHMHSSSKWVSEWVTLGSSS